MKLRSALAIAFAALGAAGPALAQTPDSVLAISRAGTSILRVNEDGSIVARGAADVGGLPAAGAGVRMMWFPARYAFRAGQVSGIQWDLGSIGYGSVAFGTNNLASGNNSFAFGDNSEAAGETSIALGLNAVSTGHRSLSFSGTAAGIGSVAIGSGSQANGEQAVALGVAAISNGLASTSIGPSITTGDFASAIGFQNSASGDYSVAIGKNASTAGQPGAVVISDASAATPADSVFAELPNQFVVRASGGVSLYTSADLTAGVQMASGAGSWSTVSDRNRKMNFAQLDGEQVLLGLRNVPVTTWSYIAQGNNVRHAGPMAQDFYAAFGLGESELMISTVDIDGITLAAVKALEARSEAQVTRISELEAQVSTLASDRALLLDRLQALEERQAQLEALLGSTDGSVAR